MMNPRQHLSTAPSSTMAEKTFFREMTASTKEDWETIMVEQKKFFTGLPDRVIAHLNLLADDYGGFPIDRLQHCLQTADLAAEDGRDEEYVIAALIHDIGDTLGSVNHADVSAAIIQPFVSEDTHWMVKHHAIFQGYNFFHYLGLDRNLRAQYGGNPNYDQTEEFVAKYDNPAFDHERPTLSLDLFEPMLRRVFAKPKNSIYLRDKNDDRFQS
jgi:predicted HD phosphohydrolase